MQLNKIVFFLFFLCKQYLGVVAIEKGASRSPSTTVTNFTFYFIQKNAEQYDGYPTIKSKRLHIILKSNYHMYVCVCVCVCVWIDLR